VTVCFAPLFLTKLFVHLPHLIRLAYPFKLLFGPLLLFYVYSLIKPSFLLKGRSLLHLLPFLIAIIYLLPFYIQTGSAKIQWLNDLLLSKKINVFNKIFEIFMILQILIYTFYIKQIIKKFQIKISTLYSSIEKVNLLWINVFINVLYGFFLFRFGIIFIFNLMEFRTIWLIKVIPIIVSVIIYAFGYKSLTQQGIFSDFDALISNEKYKKSSLSKEKAKKFTNILDQLMKEEKSYLDSDLTLIMLAERVGIPTQHLSQIINEKKGVNFYDYVNQYRIREIVSYFNDPRKNHLNVLTLAFEAGFNSKSTFNAIFKKIIGKTPFQYRKEIQNSQ
jgi:AraC-like DNA-binding protein